MPLLSTLRRCAAVALVLPLAACGGHASEKASGGRTRVSVDLGSCGSGWHPSHTGTFHLTFTNASHQEAEVRIVSAGPATTPRKVYADVDPLPLGSATDVDIALAPGAYAVQCLFEAESAIDGPTLRLRGAAPADAAPGVTAVTLDDLVTPLRRYQQWVAARLPALAGDVRTMTAALERGDRAGAQRAWRSGHARYETLGAAYDAFGELDSAINGLPNGLPRGVHDPAWTGFHAIEAGLWGTASPRSLAPLGRRLGTDVGKLAAIMKLPPLESSAEPEQKVAPGAVDALTLSIRAHEISEGSLRFALDGKDDFGAHSSLATVAANLDGTVAVLDIVSPLLDGRLERAPIDAAIARARAAVSAGRGRAVAALPLATRQEIDASVSQLTELLAPVASVLEPRRAS